MGEAASVDDRGGAAVEGTALVCVPGAAGVEVQEKLKSGVGQPHGPLRGGAEGYWGEATLSASRVEVRRTRVHRRPLTVVMVLGGSAIHAVCVDVQRQRQGERTSGMGGVFRMWAAAWAAREGWENSSWGREWI